MVIFTATKTSRGSARWLQGTQLSVQPVSKQEFEIIEKVGKDWESDKGLNIELVNLIAKARQVPDTNDTVA